MSKVIEINNLSKVYDLGLVGTGTLSKDLNRTWAKLRGKPDPYATLVELNDRTQKSSSNMVYALKDVNFSVEKGDVLGIIGKNGAGKSTLLKILSQITSPSTGTIKIKGRVASLLEVGTGMHPEMTARQNIYLNGSLMGMRRSEITSKLDEIVDFAGIEKYLDTPTKRFSSGMTVRLGFAIAAFLEPEILIVDEVLAVGDAEFQKKAIGKMKDVSQGEGRTVLFVSHNINSISRLCTRGLVLENGKMRFDGEIGAAVENYLSIGGEELISSFVPEPQSNVEIELIEAFLKNEEGSLLTKISSVLSNFVVEYKLRFKTFILLPHLTITIRNYKEEVVFFSDRMDDLNSPKMQAPGDYLVKVKFPQPLLKPGRYYVSFGIVNKDNSKTNHFRSVLSFELVDITSKRENRSGYIFKPLEWMVVRS